MKIFIHEIRLATILQRARGARLAVRMRIEQKIIAHRIWTLRFFGVDNSEDFYSILKNFINLKIFIKNRKSIKKLQVVPNRRAFSY